MRIALLVILLTTAAHAAPCPPATPKLAAAEAASFPSAIGPALTGPLAPLAWGMSAAETAKAVPALAKAIRTRLTDATGGGETSPDVWLGFAGGEIQLQVANHGLHGIQLRYPTRAQALAALAAWKAPAAPQNAQRFEFWTSAKGRARGLLRPDDEGVVVELAPFAPLTELVDTIVAGPGGKPLIGRGVADICLPSIDWRPEKERFLLPPSERSSGYYTLEATWKADKVASYRIAIDFTYDRAVKHEVSRAFAAKLGKPTAWTGDGRTCDAYGKAPIVYVCDPVQVTTWVVYVGRTP